MAYKFQKGKARLSGSLVQEGNLTIDGAFDLKLDDNRFIGIDSDSDLLKLQANQLTVAGVVSGSGALQGASAAFDGDVDAAAVSADTYVSAGSYLSAGTSLKIGSADLDQTDLLKIDGITDGAGGANKALVLDVNRKITSNVASLAAGAFNAKAGSGNHYYKMNDVTIIDQNKNILAVASYSGSGAMEGGSLVVGDTFTADSDGLISSGWDLIIENGSDAMQFSVAASSGNVLTSGSVHAASLSGSGVVSAASFAADGAAVLGGSLTAVGISAGGAISNATTISGSGVLSAASLSLDSVAVTSTAAELNILDGVTATAAEINILDGVTATAAEINFLDGADSNINSLVLPAATTISAFGASLVDDANAAAGLVTLGLSATAAELNYLDLTAAIGTATASEAVVLDASKNFAGINTLDAASMSTSANFSAGTDMSAGTFVYAGTYVSGSGDGRFMAIDLDSQADVLTKVALGSTVINSSLQSLGVQNEALNMGDFDISAAGNITAGQVSGSSAFKALSLYTANVERINSAGNLVNINGADGTTVGTLRGLFSGVDSGGDGSFAYNSATGVMTYVGPSAAEVRAHLSAGVGISYNASTGVISSDAAPIPSDHGNVNADLSEGMNWSSVAFSATSKTWKTPDASGMSGGEVVSIKCPSGAAAFPLSIAPSGSQTIDGSTDALILESDNAAIDLVYVGSDKWVIK